MRGVSRLMLRLPALRDVLRPLAAKSEGLLSLCEAYDDACETLERLRIPKTGDDPMRLEYQTICHEIETDIIEFCLRASQNA